MKLHRFKSEYVFNPNAASVSVRKNGLYFNTAATAALRLSEYKTITVDYDHANPKFAEHLYIQGSNDTKSVQNLVIGKAARESRSGNVYARFVASQQLINTFPVLLHMSTLGVQHKKGLTRLPAEFDHATNKLRVKLVPQLEHTSSNYSGLPSDGAVYAYMQGNEVVYYGQTNNLNRRVNQHSKNQWQFDHIKYSFIDTEQSRFIWEKHFLDIYRDKNGSLPRYNLIGGHENNIIEHQISVNGDAS